MTVSAFGLNSYVQSIYTINDTALTLSSSTYGIAGCNDPSSIRVRLEMTGTYLRGAPGSANVTDPVPGADEPSVFNITWQSQYLTPASTIYATVLAGICNNSLTFSPSQPTNLLGVGCINLGLAGCPEQFDVIQVSDAGNQFYFGNSSNSVDACTEEDRPTSMNPNPFTAANSTVTPTEAPTQGPSGAPTNTPTEGPSGAPTNTPTEGPTRGPTSRPTPRSAASALSYSVGLVTLLAGGLVLFFMI
jgi:cell division septation protein DedD